MNKLILKNISFTLLALVMAGCGGGKEIETPNSGIKTKCINGVNYYLFTEYKGYQGYGFMAVKYNKDGKVSLCN